MEEMAKKLDFKRFFKKIGPGFITGAADDDPSGIGTYAQTGAVFGYRQLWLAFFSVPFMVAIQEMCGRIGLVTGKGLAGALRARYGRALLSVAVLLLFLANVVNIGADLGAIASSISLVFGGGVALWLWAAVFVVLILQIYIPYPTYARILKYLTFSLFSYVAVLFIVKADWGVILSSTFWPRFVLSKEFAMNVVAFLGTTISPYLFFWQSDEEVEEEVAKGKIRAMGKGIPKVTRQDLRDMRADTVLGMVFSNLVSFFIIATTAATLHAQGIFSIETADQAAAALEPIAGPFAYLLFALGIVGTGLLAIPVLAGSASYALSEAVGWSEGLGKTFSKARGFYTAIIVATFLGLLVNFSGVPPFKMLYYSAVLNGLCAPPLIFMIIALANDRKTMGSRTNSRNSNAWGIAIGVLMTIAAGVFFYFSFAG